MNDINATLEKYGLDGKEISLYTASLSIGEANMTDLAKKASLKRPTAYLIFKSLEKKGLMASFKIKSGLRFVATRPDILLSKAKGQLEDLQSLIPQLNSLSQKSGVVPKVYYYEGKEGYITATEDSLREQNSTLRYIGSQAEIHKVIGLEYDLKHYLPTRIKNQIDFKALYFKSQISKELQERSHKEELREIKYLPEEYSYKSSTLIYGNKVAIFSTKKELITIVIESEEIAQGEREKFDLIWSLVN